ncbi:recombinase family protein [Pseudoflavonifractor phocaeensis]|uniref:recombinase family protein n=1 Tax=Pseudoflavonifractor phocaeensis TaxID=1870988 RepID=UPI00210A7539|nr:recombinase family protein [Pseudoflavonifractor phocaeensis]MCQ4862754.1 recombinase family protein [Pseudoflavonifractor phocaeensis]
MRTAIFGYKIWEGHPVKEPKEAEYVNWSFLQYKEGRSYLSIATSLEQMDIIYEPGHHWNKNMVKRLLQDIRYTGTDGYPIIVSIELYNEVNDLIISKTAGYQRPPKHIAILKPLTFCATCGNKLIRRIGGGNREAWICKDKSCPGINCIIRDSQLLSGVCKAMNHVIPTALHTPSVPPEPSFAVRRMTNEIKRLLSEQTQDADSIIKLIFECAAAKYAECSDGSQERAYIKITSLLKQAGPLKAFDAELFKNVVRKVYVSGSGTVTLELLDGRMIQEGGCGE